MAKLFRDLTVLIHSINSFIHLYFATVVIVMHAISSPSPSLPAYHLYASPERFISGLPVTSTSSKQLFEPAGDHADSTNDAVATDTVSDDDTDDSVSWCMVLGS